MFGMYLLKLLALIMPVFAFFFGLRRKRKATGSNTSAIERFLVTFDIIVASTGFAMTTARTKKSTV
jgi:hypothetical protein